MGSANEQSWIVGCELRVTTNCCAVSCAETQTTWIRNDSLEDGLNRTGHAVYSSEQSRTSSAAISWSSHSPNEHLSSPLPPTSILHPALNSTTRPRRRRRRGRRSRRRHRDIKMATVNKNLAPRSTPDAMPRGAENLLTHSSIRSLFPGLTQGLSDEDVAARIRQYGRPQMDLLKNPGHSTGDQDDQYIFFEDCSFFQLSGHMLASLTKTILSFGAITWTLEGLLSLMDSILFLYCRLTLLLSFSSFFLLLLLFRPFLPFFFAYWGCEALSFSISCWRIGNPLKVWGQMKTQRYPVKEAVLELKPVRDTRFVYEI